MEVFEKIEAQQQGHENTAVWMVGEQLKDICRRDPHCAEIVSADLENPSMSLEKAERKIKAKADELKRGMGNAHCVCVPPNVAEGIIREFYGLPAAADPTTTSVAVEAQTATAGGSFLDLDSFL